MTAALNIYQRILGVMADVDYIRKGDKKVNNQYNFVSHDAVNARLHPSFVKHGIVVIPNVVSLAQEGNRTSVCLRTDFINADNPSDKVEVLSWGYGIDPSDKGPGKAVSYAYKYALLKTFCLETGDDPDEVQNNKFEQIEDHKPTGNPQNRNTISEKQLSLLMGLLKKFDSKYVEFLENEYQKNYGIHEWSEFPKDKFQGFLDFLTAKSQEKKAA